MWRTDAHWIFYWLLCENLSAHWRFVGSRTALSVTFGTNVIAFLRAPQALVNKYLLERKMCQTKLWCAHFLSNIRFICNIHSVSNRRFMSNKHFVSNTRFISSIIFITLDNDQLDAHFLNTFITILYMYIFRAISYSSSGGQIVLIQHLVSSLSVSDDTRCCIDTVWPPEDEQDIARNMYM